MRKVTMLMVLAMVVPMLATAQDMVWKTQSAFPADSSLILRNNDITGIAVDAEGKVWIAPYYFNTDTLDVTLRTLDEQRDSVKTDGRLSFLHIYNADGTKASFSPLTILRDKQGNVVDTLGGKTIRNSTGRQIWDYRTLRGVTADADGNIIVTAYQDVFKIDHTDGTFMASRHTVQDGADPRGLAGPTADGQGGIYIHSVFGGFPVVRYDSNLENPEVMIAASPGFSRTNLVSEDGLTMYFPAYSTSNVFVYTRADEFSAFAKVDSINGPKTESINLDTEGALWISSGSFNDFPAPPFSPKTHYKYDTANLSAAPSDSLKWYDKTSAPDDAMSPVFEGGRPRGIAFGDASTAYIGQFNMFEAGRPAVELLGVQLVKRMATSNEESAFTPAQFALGQNYPNPFNPSTQIEYTMGKSGMVTLKVYDSIGREVATLVNTFVNSGKHTVNFDATNLASGTYIYVMQSGSVRLVNKMTLIK